MDLHVFTGMARLELKAANKDQSMIQASETPDYANRERQETQTSTTQQ
jgi:hypothetical protein